MAKQYGWDKEAIVIERTLRPRGQPFSITSIGKTVKNRSRSKIARRFYKLGVEDIKSTLTSQQDGQLLNHTPD